MWPLVLSPNALREDIRFAVGQVNQNDLRVSRCENLLAIGLHFDLVIAERKRNLRSVSRKATIAFAQSELTSWTYALCPLIQRELRHKIYCSYIGFGWAASASRNAARLLLSIMAVPLSFPDPSIGAGAEGPSV